MDHSYETHWLNYFFAAIIDPEGSLPNKANCDDFNHYMFDDTSNKKTQNRLKAVYDALPSNDNIRDFIGMTDALNSLGKGMIANAVGSGGLETRSKKQLAANKKVVKGQSFDVAFGIVSVTDPQTGMNPLARYYAGQLMQNIYTDLGTLANFKLTKNQKKKLQDGRNEYNALKKLGDPNDANDWAYGVQIQWNWNRKFHTRDLQGHHLEERDDDDSCPASPGSGSNTDSNTATGNGTGMATATSSSPTFRTALSLHIPIPTFDEPPPPSSVVATSPSVVCVTGLPPAPSPHDDCHTTYEFFYDAVTISGSAWDSGKFGREGIGLQDAVSECGEISHWHLTSPAPGWDFTVTFRIGALMQKCIASKLEQAGSPGDVCDGTG
ncbi:MAG: hypothetical protein Q9165_000378 [Trypethelium subeluteriae]